MFFDRSNGLLSALSLSGHPILRRGPVTNLWRAPTDNDRGAGPVFGVPYGQLRSDNGLERLSLEDASVTARQESPSLVTLDEPPYRYRYRMRAVDLSRDDLEELLAYELPSSR